MEPDRLFARYEPGARRAPLGDLAVRAARDGDLDAIAALSAERDGGDAAGLAERLRSRLAQDGVYLLVARHAGRTVGFGRIWRYRHPPEAPAHAAPEGWYLGGVIVEPALRRRGVASALTARRLAWIAQRTDRAYYCANAQNRASIDLHAHFGFEELARDFWIPGVSFTGGEGRLFRALLHA